MALICCVNGVWAQPGVRWKWWEPSRNDFPVIEGRPWEGEYLRAYDRLPERMQPRVREVVWTKSHETAGLVVRFRSNAAHIRVRYTVGGRIAFEHMPATGVSGVDLYALDGKGRWEWPGLLYVFGDTVVYDFHVQRCVDGREYFLYLPLYNKVSWLEVGVPESAALRPLPVRKDWPVIVYGTSIVQGGCASRPGMAWTAVLGRRLHLPVVNLGFSSNGLLEKPLIDLMSEVEARVFILDCLPNMIALPGDTIRGRIIRAVEGLRARRPGTPIVITEHGDARIGVTDTLLDGPFKVANIHARAAFDALKKRGVKGIYYLSAAEIGMDAESTVDGSHPNDLGMVRYADAYARLLRKIFSAAARH